MANIDSLPNKKGANKKKSVKGKANAFMTLDRWEMVKFAIGAVIVTLALIVTALFIGYIQIMQNTFNDYKSTIQEYQNTRYDTLEKRVKDLENRTTPTSLPKPT